MNEEILALFLILSTLLVYQVPGTNFTLQRKLLALTFVSRTSNFQHPTFNFSLQSHSIDTTVCFELVISCGGMATLVFFFLRFSPFFLSRFLFVNYGCFPGCCNLFCNYNLSCFRHLFSLFLFFHLLFSLVVFFRCVFFCLIYMFCFLISLEGL